MVKKKTKATPEDSRELTLGMDKGSPHYEDSYWEYVDAIIEQRKKNKKTIIKKD